MQPLRFSIDVPYSVLDDLQARVSRTVWPYSVCRDDWQLGTRPGPGTMACRLLQMGSTRRIAGASGA